MSRLSAAQYHDIVLGTAPTQEQSKLYTQWPRYRGFSDRAQEPLLAEAVVILALKASVGTDHVLLLAPPAMEAWMLQQIEALAMRAFRGSKERYSDRAKEFIHGYIQLFRKLKMTGRVLQLREEPAHWVSFGFSAEDELPPWMPGRLLTLE